MIDFNAEIISGFSLGNVRLNENISSYTNEIYSCFDVEVRSYSIPDGSKNNAYILNKTLTIATNHDGFVFSIGCNQEYKGRYKNILHTGQSMKEIIALTERLRIFNGSVIIDDDFGFSLILPSPYDEIADSIENIPNDIIFNQIYVSDFSMWRSGH
ncbi:hypothetical protein [Erwinia oleae]|uniref:hypothetical protein n=1 Tax=Erwinia oleae TaxID=796334 RepID=UPI0009077F65|nr:hypothetical protein [Erwinia oleae]